MKSILLTFVIFAVVIGSAKIGIFEVMGSSYFHYFAFISLIIVFGAAIYFVGIPKNDKTSTADKEDKHEEN